MKYHVREARHSDIAKLTELRVKQLEERVTDLKPEVALSTMRHLNDELGNRVRAWVAELDGEVIGCALVDVNHGMPRPSNPSGVYGELLGAYILPDHRNHTLGTVLITELVVDLRGSEFGYIKVDVDELLPQDWLQPSRTGVAPPLQQVKPRVPREGSLIISDGRLGSGGGYR